MSHCKSIAGMQCKFNVSMILHDFIPDCEEASSVVEGGEIVLTWDAL